MLLLSICHTHKDVFVCECVCRLTLCGCVRVFLMDIIMINSWKIAEQSLWAVSWTLALQLSFFFNCVILQLLLALLNYNIWIIWMWIIYTYWDVVMRFVANQLFFEGFQMLQHVCHVTAMSRCFSNLTHHMVSQPRLVICCSNQQRLSKCLHKPLSVVL